MSNQAYSEASDLMVGAGSIYFRRFDDANQLHFLGNVSEFNITTDVTTVEKYSSMNKKRELMASVTTQTQASGSMVLNEYNMYNLALGMYGVENVHQQQGTTLVSTAYTVPSVPGIIELKDADGNRYYNVSNVSVAPLAAIPPSATLTGSGTDPNGGTVTVNGAGYTGTNNATIYYTIVTANTNAGDLDGFEVRLATSALALNTAMAVDVVATAGTQSLIATIDGVDVTFTIGATDSFSASNGNIFTINVTAGITVYEPNKDYTADDIDLRAGLIKIRPNSRIQEGSTVSINATVPAEDFITVSGASAGKIEGELLFVGDPNQGNAITIEAWKCSLRPDGDMSGLIGEDFGEFTINFNIMSDYENHYDYPLYKVTKVAESVYKPNDFGKYDPNE